MEKLSETELGIAKDIVRSGLQKAAESMSFFMKQKIDFNLPDFSLARIDADFKVSTKTGNNLHVLMTNVIGELKGVCCLTFSEEEADHLRQTALPPEILNSPAMMAEMADAILLEVDNIISASVITQFSNILGHKMHGGVPKLAKLNSTELPQFVSSDIQKELYSIRFSTQFTSGLVRFSPDFVWLFDDVFFRSIREFSQNAASVARLRIA